MVSLISPLKCDNVVWQLSDKVGVVQDDVSPELHVPSVAPHQFVNLQEKVKVDTASAVLANRLSTSPFSQGDFIASNVELCAREVG